MDISKFHFYSVGIVAENKKLSEKTIKAVPIEVVPVLDGELRSSPSDLEHEGTDRKGDRYSVSVTTDNALTARWIPLGNSNRVTPPDVRRGEQVMLLRFADSDEFFWVSMGLDEHLRRLETVVFRISASDDEDDTEINADNSYFVELSSHKKNVTLRTSKAHGEPFSYLFQFNTKDGVVSLADDDDNYFEMASRPRRLTLRNRDNTFLVLDKENLHAHAPSMIEARTKTANLICETLSVLASKETVFNTPAFIVNGETFTVKGTTATFEDNDMELTKGNFQATVGNVAALGTGVFGGGFGGGGGSMAPPAAQPVQGGASGITMAFTDSEGNSVGAEIEISGEGIVVGEEGTVVVGTVDIGPLHTHTSPDGGGETSPVLE